MQKADVVTRNARMAKTRLFQRLMRDDLWEEVVNVAKARHILGHYEYGDGNFLRWEDGKVTAAIIEELADAVVYQSWLEERGAATL